MVRRQLAALVRELMLHDFYALVQVLYRVDVAEEKIKKLLQDHPDADSSEGIADLLLQRSAEKRAAREAFRQQGDIPGEERW